jgi:hypothetical protein
MPDHLPLLDDGAGSRRQASRADVYDPIPIVGTGANSGSRRGKKADSNLAGLQTLAASLTSSSGQQGGGHRSSPSPSVVAKEHMTLPPRLSFSDLMGKVRSFLPENRAEPGFLAFAMPVAVICHFLGKQWYLDNIAQDARHSRQAGFLRLDFTPEFQSLKTARISDFAEMLFNLQYVEGFDDRIDQMRTASVEATYAEFDLARFLYIHEIAFKFVTPEGVKGEDYDFEVEYSDGRKACVDAKCRLEGTEVRADTIRNSLNKARSNNLPADKPGIVFVKVPQIWFEQADVYRGICAVVERFLRPENTQRIVSVVLYTTAAMEVAEQKTLHRHRFREFPGLEHRFDLTKNWTLFKDFKVPEGWREKHPRWVPVFSEQFTMRDR